MNQEKYLVSFGNSRTYVANSRSLIDEIYNQLKQDMERRFPAMDPSAMPNPTIRPCSDPEVYRNYPELTSEALTPVLATLVTRCEVRSDTRELNLDAPWSDIK